MKRTLRTLAAVFLLAAAMTCAAFAAGPASTVNIEGTLTANAENYSASYTKATPGNEYVMWVLKGDRNNFSIAQDNILYMNQATANSSGAVSFTFIPMEVMDSVVVLTGNFPDNTTQKILGELEAAVAPVAASITIQHQNSTIQIPQTGGWIEELTAVVKDQNGNVMKDAQVTWSVTKATGVQMAEDGVWIQSSAQAGTITITATCGTAKATTTITLVKPVVPDPAVPAVVRIVNLPASVEILPSGQQTIPLTATVTDQYGKVMTDVEVKWSVDAATGVSIQGDNLIISSNAQAGAITICAQAGTVEGCNKITLTKAAPAPAEPTYISIAAPTSVDIPNSGKVSAELTATVKDQYGQNMNSAAVSWSVSNATGVSITSKGVLTITSSAPAGTVAVTATSGKATSTVYITLTKSAAPVEPVATGIVISGAPTVPASIPVKGKLTIQLTATVLDQNGQVMKNAEVDWSIPKTLGVIMKDGELSVSNQLEPGSLVVTAKCGKAKATVTIEFVKPAGSSITIVDMPTTISVPDKGSVSYELKAQVKDQSGNVMDDPELEWTIRKTTGVSLKKGNLVISNKTAAGKLVLSVESGDAQTSIVIELVKAEPASIVILDAPTAVNVPDKGKESVEFKAQVKDQFGNIMDDPDIEWSIPKTTGVTMKGDTLSVSNKAPSGKLTITAESGTAKASVTVELMKLEAKSIVIDKVAPIDGTAKKTSVVLNATVYDQFGNVMNDPDIDWSIPKTTGISLSKGKLSVTNKVNVASITVTAECGDATASLVIKIDKPVPASIEIEAAKKNPVDVSAKKTYVELEATVYDQDGNKMNDPDVDWSIPKTTGITMKKGKLTITDKASVASIKVTAQCGDAVATYTVELNKPVPAKIEIEADKKNPVDVSAKKTYVELEATVYDQDGNKMNDPDVDWSIPKTTGITMKKGKLTITNKANVASIEVTAQCGDAVATYTVELNKPIPATIEIEAPSFANIPDKSKTTVELEAEVYDQDGNEMDDPKVDWKLKEKVSGVTLSKGKLSITSKAKAGEVIVVAECGDAQAEVTITLEKVEPASISIEKIGTVTIPAKGTAYAELDADVKDNKGREMDDPDITWKLAEKATGVSIKKGKLAVTSKAKPCTVVIEAECGDVTDTITVTIQAAQ